MSKFNFKLFFFLIIIFSPALSYSSQSNLYLQDKIEIGKDNFKAKEFEKSYKIFKELFLENPANETINFYLGRSAFELKKYEEAIFAFERMLISYPDLLRIKLEIARSYMALGSNEEAKRLFYEVLNENPPEDVKKNILFMLKTIDSIQKKHRFSGSVEFGYGYDDNANTTPTDKIIEIPAFSNLPMELEGKESDYFFTSSADISYAYNLNFQRLNHIKTDFFYQKNAYDSEDEQSLDFLSFAITPNFTLSSDTSLDASIVAQHISINDKTYLNTAGARLNFKKKILQSGRINLGLSYTEKRYDEDYDSKDGWNSGIAVSFTKGFKKFLLTPFADYSIEKTDLDIYSFKRYSGGIGLLYLPVSKITISGFYRIQQSDYDKEEPLFLEKRKDTANFVSGDIKWMFYQNSKKTFFAYLGLSHLFIKNDSNADIYEYKKNKTTAYVKLSF
jgi:tetratricopeptide (TPR) repeat protein